MPRKTPRKISPETRLKNIEASRRHRERLKSERTKLDNHKASKNKSLCSYKTCQTKLNRYNDSGVCYAHQRDSFLQEISLQFNH